MNEIICPHCQKAFKVDEAGFADIVKQVRDSEFSRELQDRQEIADKQMESAVQLAEARAKNELQLKIVEKEAEVEKVRSEKEAELVKVKSEKDAELAKLIASVESSETEKKLAVTLAGNKAEKERDELSGELKSKDAEMQLLESSLKEKHAMQLKDRDETIERMRDMKAKLSVKLLGENLEQHCQNEFNGVRTSLFPFAYFEKDNEAVKDVDDSKGTKGDYIYKDYDALGGTEIISIMFEMKDEQDDSTNKRTVESHLKKLDDDRRKKGCEFAVMVTQLEADNELYNRGIVDMSYKYERMLVIRPQFFLPLISLLKGANLKSLEVKRQLVLVQSQNVDITTFENDMNDWKDGWLKVMKNAGSKQLKALSRSIKL
jgi:hypothetical protein